MDNATFTYPEDLCDGSVKPGSNCITDSGNPILELPIPAEMCNTAFTDYALKSDLIVDIEGSDGSTVSLSFPLAFLVDQHAQDWTAALSSECPCISTTTWFLTWAMKRLYLLTSLKISTSPKRFLRIMSLQLTLALLVTTLLRALKILESVMQPSAVFVRRLLLPLLFYVE
jgi:hypothetical protein